MKHVIRACGHENVTARHASTLELTSETFLTPAGDCILGIDADRTPADFDPAFVAACRDRNATIALELCVEGETQTVRGRGHPDLEFDSDRSLVCRTSEYVDERTVMVGADRAAADLDRELVAALAEGAALIAEFRVE